ncbi:MAG: GtrA family protein, partial [Acutalibacteraceae bacterium]|nr:GtrA family protein [Acutalibacteraceae bacterium]
MSEFGIRLKNTFLSKKFIGFCLIGIINTFNTAFFSWLAHFKIQQNISAYIGYIISLTINYILNSKIVFKCKLSVKKYFYFLLSYI